MEKVQGEKTLQWIWLMMTQIESKGRISELKTHLLSRACRGVVRIRENNQCSRSILGNSDRPNISSLLKRWLNILVSACCWINTLQKPWSKRTRLFEASVWAWHHGATQIQQVSHDVEVKKAAGDRWSSFKIKLSHLLNLFNFYRITWQIFTA